MSRVTTICRSSNFTQQRYPSTCFWQKTGYLALKNDSNAGMYGYVYFPLPFNKGVVVTSGHLFLKTRALGAMTNRTITVEALSKPVNLSKMTWNSQGAVTTKDSVTVTKSGALPDNTVWDFSIGKMLQDFSDGQAYYGFRIRTNDPNTVMVQGHYMGTAFSPSLFAMWSDAPLPPDTLSPAGGRVVAEPAPVLRFNFADYSGDTDIASCRVQMGTTAAVSDWDSGEIATTMPQLDLSQTSWKPPSGEGTMVYWRVCVRDGSGLWSDWSDVTSWTYYAQPTVTLTNPDSTGVVTDNTPPIDWVYRSPNGSNQTSFWVALYRQTNSGWLKLEESGRVPGTATEWTPTTRLGYNGNYRVTVCVWDGRIREATPGFETFVGVSQEFKFKAGSPAAPTNGTFTDLSPYPSLSIAWSSPTEPDRWEIFCDGEPFANYPGDALSRGGDKYSITDTIVPPRKVHTYSIHAIQNGVSSQPLNIRAVSKPLGTWIYSLDYKQKLCIVNDREREVQFTEDTSTFNVVGAHSTIVVNKSLRGYEGTLKGLLRAVPQLPGIDSIDWKNTALDIKGNVGARYWVIWGDEAFQAVLSDVQVSRSTAMPDSYDFSCKFYQQTDLDFKE